MPGRLPPTGGTGCPESPISVILPPTSAGLAVNSETNVEDAVRNASVDAASVVWSLKIA